MGKLIFNAKDLLRVVEHSLAAKEHTPPVIDYTDDGKAVYGKAEPCVVLVHDQGVYLMSNGLPRDIADAEKNRSYIVYAKGCDPDEDVFWYDNSRALVGGDDFAEYLPWCLEIKTYIEKDKADQIIISVTKDKLSLGAKRGK